MRAVNATGNGVASYTTTAIAPAAATLTASSVKYATGTLTIGLHSGNWYYKYTVPSGGTCQGPVSGSSKNLTGLASNTRYIFKAYSDSACSTELTIDTSDADFSTRLGKLTGVQVEPRHQSAGDLLDGRGRRRRLYHLLEIRQPELGHPDQVRDRRHIEYAVVAHERRRILPTS